MEAAPADRMDWMEALANHVGRGGEPPERGSAPSHCQKHPLKMKEKLMKHRFKPISIKVMVVLTFILGLYLCKIAVIHHLALK